jgi:hypothetical protein
LQRHPSPDTALVESPNYVGACVNLDVVASPEWFGDGWTAYREALFSPAPGYDESASHVRSLNGHSDVMTESGERAMWEQELRAAWVSMRNEADALGVASKDSQGVLGTLFGHYRRLAQGERSVINRLLAEQLRSDHEGLRFDAMALIQEFRIVSALDDLRAFGPRPAGE